MSGNRVFSKKRNKKESRGGKTVLTSQESARNKWKGNTDAIPRKTLSGLYKEERKSMQEIADQLGCSLHKISYWMEKYKISRRGRGEATYWKRNPKGDPFVLKKLQTKKDYQLFGMGLGLYWGEGTKSDDASIRLGNTDPKLIGTFMMFLTNIYSVSKRDMRFGLQIFSDTKPGTALLFWCKKLRISPSQFQKIIVTPSRGKVTYKRKLPYGVLTIQFHNKKLRQVIGKEMEQLMPE